MIQIKIQIFNSLEHPLREKGTILLTLLHIVRHGVTWENLNFTLIGSSNPQLHPFGIQQAESVREHLRPKPLSIIFSSPLQRARQTAETIQAAHPNTPLIIDEDLAEIDLGIVDGLSSFVAYENYKEWMDQALVETSTDFSFPNGESRIHAFHRITRFLAKTTAKYPSDEVCVVTHGGLIGVWIAHLHGEPSGRFRAWSPKHASCSTILAEQDHYEILAWNETSYLSPDLQQTIERMRKD